MVYETQMGNPLAQSLFGDGALPHPGIPRKNDSDAIIFDLPYHDS